MTFCVFSKCRLFLTFHSFNFLFSLIILSTLQDVTQSLHMFPAAQNIQVVFMQVFLRLVFFNKYIDGIVYTVTRTVSVVILKLYQYKVLHSPVGSAACSQHRGSKLTGFYY